MTVDVDAVRVLRRLLDARPITALGTLRSGEPTGSMVPFVLPRGGTRLIIHVNALAPHKRDIREHPRVGLLVMAESDTDAMPQALPREGADYAAARTAYLDRFPDAEVTFALGDSSLVALQPLSARLVAGFGRAEALVGDALAAWLRG